MTMAGIGGSLYYIWVGCRKQAGLGVPAEDKQAKEQLVKLLKQMSNTIPDGVRIGNAVMQI